MKDNGYMYKKKGFIAHNLLYSNFEDCNYRLTFAGGEELNGQKAWRIHLIFSYTDLQNGIGYSSNIVITADPGDEIRFENYLGMKGNKAAEYEDKRQGGSAPFLTVRYLKILAMGSDFIEYEIHCL